MRYTLCVVNFVHIGTETVVSQAYLILRVYTYNTMKKLAHDDVKSAYLFWRSWWAGGAAAYFTRPVKNATVYTCVGLNERERGKFSKLFKTLVFFFWGKFRRRKLRFGNLMKIIPNTKGFPRARPSSFVTKMTRVFAQFFFLRRRFNVTF